MKLTRWLVLSAACLGMACDESGRSAEGEQDAAARVDAVAADARVDAAPAPDTRPPEVACTARFVYDPLVDPERGAMPDDVWTVEDATTETGLRIDTSAAPWRASTPPALKPLFEDLDTLDGWGVSAGIVLRFDAPVAAVKGGEATATEGPIQLWAMPTGEAATRVPFEVQTLDDGATLVLWPMRPLPEATRAGVVVKRALSGADGGCIEPSPTLRMVWSGEASAPALSRLTARHADLFDVAGVSVGDVAGSLVFTTQSATRVSVEVAAAIRLAGPDVAASAPAASCTPQANAVRCEGTLTLTNFRDDNGRIADAASDLRYEVPYSLSLPLERVGPAPLLVAGHGLAGGRDIAGDLASALAPDGFAVLALDAVGHGEHPTRAQADTALAVLTFLGLDVTTQTVHGLWLRDNLRQSNFDRLQALEVLRARPDVDGDGTPDVDTDRLAYWGISLGGIMGSELIALDGGFDAAVLTVAGARLMPLITEASSFATFRPIIGNLVGGEAELDRSLPLVQALVDGGDPVAFAGHVLGAPLPGARGRVPHLLQQMVINDETVSNGTNRSLARALGVPLVPPVVQDVGLVLVEDSAPVVGNIEGGRTAGLFQFDRMRTSRNGRPVPASHNNALGLEGFGQVYRFLSGWVSGETPEIIDPYATFMTP